MLKILFSTSFLFLVFGQFSSISKSEGVNVYLFDVFILLFVSVGLAHLLVSKRLLVPKTLIPFFIFCLIGLTTLVANIYRLALPEFFVSFSYLFRLFVYLLFSLILFNFIKSNVFSIDFVVKTVLISGAFICLFGFMQLLVLPNFEVLDPSLGWDPHKYRLASTFFDPNFTGAYINLCLILLLYFKFDLKGQMSKKLFVALAFLYLISLFLTFSRSSWLMFSIIVFIYGVVKSPKLILFAGILAFLAYFAVPRIQTRIAGSTDPADSAYFRFISWRNAAEIFKDNAVAGVGFNSYRYAQLDYGFISGETLDSHSGAGSDSSLLLVLATTGVVGFTVFFAGLVQPFFLFIKSKEFTFYTATFLSLMMHALFVNSLFYSQIAILWMFFIVLAETANSSSRI